MSFFLTKNLIYLHQGDDMNNKGFAVTTMVYATIVLLAISMFTALAIVNAEYTNQKSIIEKVNNDLNVCLEAGGCTNE